MTINSQEWSLIFSIVKKVGLLFINGRRKKKARKDVSRI